MDKVADLADKFGSGTIRMTVEGNILVLDIPEDKLAQAVAAADAIEGFATKPDMILKNTVACAGNQ